ncbi:MAG: HAD family phosphatase [Verrucomicrobiota bacterium]
MRHDFLFDIGNVILKFDFSLAVRRIEDRCSKVHADEILPTISDLTEGLESGRISTGAYIAEVSERLGFSGSVEDFIRAFENIFTPNLEMIALIDQLKQKGHRLYLLSNTNGIHVPFFTREYPVFDLFSGATYSHEIGCMKPNAGIYQSAIQQFELKAESTIYIDDLEANVVAGSDLGLLGIHYDPEQHQRLINDLRQHGIAVSD